MTTFYAPNGAGDLLSRYCFLEPLVSGRRVLEIGAARATGGFSAIGLAERGASAVLSIEDDGRGLGVLPRDVPKQVQFRTVAIEDLPERSFDLVVVADGAQLATHPERLAAIAALLSPRGFLTTAL